MNEINVFVVDLFRFLIYIFYDISRIEFLTRCILFEIQYSFEIIQNIILIGKIRIKNDLQISKISKSNQNIFAKSMNFWQEALSNLCAKVLKNPPFLAVKSLQMFSQIHTFLALDI